MIPPGGEADVYLRSSPRERSAALSTELKEVRIAQQFGLGYLPLMIARQYGLIEKHASAAGLGNIRVVWSRFPSGKSMNAALQAGFLDIAYQKKQTIKFGVGFAHSCQGAAAVIETVYGLDTRSKN